MYTAIFLKPERCEGQVVLYAGPLN